MWGFLGARTFERTEGEAPFLWEGSGNQRAPPRVGTLASVSGELARFWRGWCKTPGTKPRPQGDRTFSLPLLVTAKLDSKGLVEGTVL